MKQAKCQWKLVLLQKGHGEAKLMAEELRKGAVCYGLAQAPQSVNMGFVLTFLQANRGSV